MPNYPRLLIADPKGNIVDVPGFAAAGMKAGHYFRLRAEDLIKLPAGSELFTLPDRAPVGFDVTKGRFSRLDKDPFSGGAAYPVAAFVSSGHTTTYNAAYTEKKISMPLPLFSYAAAAYYRGGIYAASYQVDREQRHDQRLIDMPQVKSGIKRIERLFPENRLIRHLEDCALIHGCAGAKNFFLNKYEAPLPVSPVCNARCAGCISYQNDNKHPVVQPRIRFVPSPAELAEAAVFYAEKTADPIYSFGQGCEGEPMVMAGTIEEAIRLIRRETKKGMININTNAGRPGAMSRLLDAGLDSIRVSMNSAQDKFYLRYYSPRDYDLNDVKESIKIAKKKGAFVSLNYLVMPGFTDSKEEAAAFAAFIKKYNIDMIQWRNLNFDPLEYFKVLKVRPGPSDLIGVRELIGSMKKRFPRLMMGYFNPSRGRIRRFRQRMV